MTMALDVKISFSWTNYCRLCLLDNGIMLPLFEEEGLSRQLGHKIEACLQLVTYDGDPLPRRICHKCLHKINQTFEFRTMALQSYERLKTHLLPLRHCPEVEQYLERADLAQTRMDCDGAASGHCSTLTASKKANRTKIHIKTEKEPIEDPKSLPSHMDTTEQDSPFSTASCTSTPRTSITMNEGDSSASHIHHDPMKQKRNKGSTDMSAVDPMSHTSEGATRKKQLVGPASRKRQFQNSQWNCVLCAATFGSRNALLKHQEKCLKCATCEQEFSSVAEKAKHEAEAHIVVMIDCNKRHLRQRCSRCPAQYASNVMLTSHFNNEHIASRSSEVHHSSDVEPGRLEKDKILNSIQNEFNAMTDSDKIVKGNMKKMDNEFHCNDLSESEDDFPLSKLKGDGKYANSNGPLTCPKCCKIFLTPVLYEGHVCAPVSSGSYCCQLCNESFHGAHVLLEHEISIHGRYKCTICSKRFNSPQAHNSHKKLHYNTNRKAAEKEDSVVKKASTGGKKKSLSCHTCFAEFEEEDAFILHLYKHATEQSDDENIPKKKSRKSQKFGRPRNSIDPAEEIDGRSEQFSIKCERCHYVCRSKEYYKIHLATHMSKVKTSFPCSGCTQDFRNVEALNRHTCSGKQPENVQTCCLDCGQALVEGEDHVCDNKCPVCDKVFKSARGQRLHFSSKHQIKAHDGDDFSNDPQLLSLDGNQAELEEEQDTNLKEAEQRPETNDHGASDSEASSLIGDSPPSKRLPPDGAPLDDPVPCLSIQSSNHITLSALLNDSKSCMSIPPSNHLTLSALLNDSEPKNNALPLIVTNSPSKDIVPPIVCHDSAGDTV